MTVRTTTKEFLDELAEERHAQAVSYPRRRVAKAAPIPTKILTVLYFALQISVPSGVNWKLFFRYQAAVISHIRARSFAKTTAKFSQRWRT